MPQPYFDFETTPDKELEKYDTLEQIILERYDGARLLDEFENDARDMCSSWRARVVFKLFADEINNKVDINEVSEWASPKGDDYTEKVEMMMVNEYIHKVRLEIMDEYEWAIRKNPTKMLIEHQVGRNKGCERE